MSVLLKFHFFLSYDIWVVLVCRIQETHGTETYILQEHSFLFSPALPISWNQFHRHTANSSRLACMLTFADSSCELESVTLYVSSCLQLNLQKNEFLHLLTWFSTSTEYLQYICCLPMSSQHLPAGLSEEHPLQNPCLRVSHLLGALSSSHQRLIYQVTQERN